MANSENVREVERLAQVLSGLEVTVSKGKDGRLTAYTTSEPLFCFERPSEKELEDLIVDTLRSYVENFYDLRGLKVEIRSTPEKVSEIPIERLVPISRVRPFIQPRPERERQLEPA